jgi:4-hydroxy-tetrahydrodipicolinate synthase
MSQLFTGAGVALITPFTQKNQIDYTVLETIVENQVKGGMDYLVALGTTAESVTLSNEEKSKTIQCVRGNSGKLPVVVGMGGNDTQAIINQIKSTNLDGISGLLIVTPYYNRPSQEGMFRHYSAIAKESPLPIILYNVPSRTGVNLEYDTVVRLAEASDKIVAVKEASGIMSQIASISKYTPDSFTMISGDDVLALPTTTIGGKGVISVLANAMPSKVSSLIHFALKGNYSEATKIHFELIDLFKLIFKEGNPGGIKALMHFQGIIENELRSPMYKVSEATYNEIKEAYLKVK